MSKYDELAAAKKAENTMEKAARLEEDVQNAKAFSEAFINALDTSSESQMLKKAADYTTAFTRRRLREEAFTPAILPFERVDNSDLAYQLTTDDLMIIYEMENDQYPAVTVPFNATDESRPYYMNKYPLVFFQNTTPNWTKNVQYLRTYKSNVRELVADNAIRDLSRQKDFYFMSQVDSITGIVPGEVSPFGMEQYVYYPGRLTRDNWINCSKLLQNRMLINGVFLCNINTWAEFKRWTRNEMGGDFAQEIIVEGDSKAFGRAKFSDIDFIVTMQTDLVANGIIYQFAPPNYLGHAAVLMPPTMYVKKEKDILSFSCREIIGMSIGNVAAVQKVGIQSAMGTYGGDGRLDSSGNPMTDPTAPPTPGAGG